MNEDVILQALLELREEKYPNLNLQLIKDCYDIQIVNVFTENRLNIQSQMRGLIDEFLTENIERREP
jgi:hypothetical protein